MEATIPSIPGYEILGELGRGGMGVVYKARHLEHDRLIAVKMILSGRGASVAELARFRVEAEVIASLAHPNVVLIHEVGAHLGYPFFVLEYGSGGSLADRIRSRPMPCDWTAYVSLKIARAMEHAHERGIIHRDLKPSNVLLMSDEIPKVTDFGLAKFVDAQYRFNALQNVTCSIPEGVFEVLELEEEIERFRGTADNSNKTVEYHAIRTLWNKRIGSSNAEDEGRFERIGVFIRDAIQQSSLNSPESLQLRGKLTQTGAVMGTPHYMSPEQAWGRVKQVGPASDIYSLGAIMYEMLTGQPPFGGDAFQVVSNVRNKPPVSPRERRDSVDPVLESICIRCLEKQPEHRYQSMGRLAEDLERFIAGAGVSEPGQGAMRGDGVSGAGGLDEGARATTSVATETVETSQDQTRSWWRFWR